MENLKKRAEQDVFLIKVNYRELKKMKQLLEENEELKQISNSIDFKIIKHKYYKDKYKNELGNMINDL